VFLINHHIFQRRERFRSANCPDFTQQSVSSGMGNYGRLVWPNNTCDNWCCKCVIFIPAYCRSFWGVHYRWQAINAGVNVQFILSVFRSRQRPDFTPNGCTVLPSDTQKRCMPRIQVQNIRFRRRLLAAQSLLLSRWLSSLGGWAQYFTIFLAYLLIAFYFMWNGSKRVGSQFQAGFVWSKVHTVDFLVGGLVSLLLAPVLNINKPRDFLGNGAQISGWEYWWWLVDWLCWHFAAK